jgi:hypothetical protein
MAAGSTGRCNIYSLAIERGGVVTLYFPDTKKPGHSGSVSGADNRHIEFLACPCAAPRPKQISALRFPPQIWSNSTLKGMLKPGLGVQPCPKQFTNRTDANYTI